jgi:TfoX/Sxy family transcriptional regulator of competence genes
MAYSEALADRLRNYFSSVRKVEEKKMFGGLCFMVDDKMCVGAVGDELMARIDPETFDAALKKKGVRPMDHSGKSMKGFIFVAPHAIDNEKDLKYWLNEALEFNPKAKSSKKPAKKA